jgi:N-methylhydantoinase A
MTWADPMRDYSVAIGASFSSNAETDPPVADVGSRLSDLADRATSELGSSAVLEIAADLRYEGQGFELSVPWSGSSFEELLQAFHAEHLKRYGHADPDRPVELVTLRLHAHIPRNPLESESLKSGPSDSRKAIVGRRHVVHDPPLEVPVYARDRLLAGNFIPGPAIVTQMDSTTLVLPNWNAVVDGAGNLVVERS